MIKRRLGSQGPELSVIGYGAWEASEHWGPVDEDALIAAIHAAIDAGVNWIDTAEVYGPHTSEKIVGRAIADRPDVLVATKVAPAPAGTGFDKDAVRRACDASLGRLGRDAIDLYQLHWPDRRIPVEETWGAMALLAEEGFVKAVGVSNFDQTLIERCEAIRHVDSIQPHVSMLHRGNLPLVKWCGEHGIGAVAYSPLACGLLTGAITRETGFHEDDWRSGSRGFTMYDELFGTHLESNLRTVEQLQVIADEAGMSLPNMAIAWVLAQPGITSAIIGSRNPNHMRANATAASARFDADVAAQIGNVLA